MQKEVSRKVAWTLVIFLFVLLILSVYTFVKYIEFNKERVDMIRNLDTIGHFAHDITNYANVKDYENLLKFCERVEGLSLIRSFCYFHITIAKSVVNKEHQLNEEECKSLPKLEPLPFKYKLFGFLEEGRWAKDQNKDYFTQSCLSLLEVKRKEILTK